MSTPSNDSKEFDELLMATVERELTPAEQERLAALLQGNPALQQRYLSYLFVDAQLRWEQPTPGSQSARPATRWYRSWRWLAVIAAMATLAVIGFVMWNRPSPTPTTTDPPLGEPAERTDDSVAVLASTVGAVWGESVLPTRPGSPLPAGRMRLISGVVRIEFYCGATVILEGPADFQLVSRTRAFCSEGKLRAIVPPHADGFAIETPSLELVDRGTEFGLRVGRGNPTEVHVFQGKVDVYDPIAADERAPLRSLTTGQGVRHDAGDTKPINTDPASFVTARQLEDRLVAEIAQRNREWSAAVTEWHRDPALLLHFNFQGDPISGRTLTDQAGRLPGGDGSVVGCQRTGGRWVGRRGLEFKRVSDRVRLNIPGEFKSVTMAAWVRVDGLPNVNNSLLMADGWEVGEAHWQILQDGTLVLGVQAESKETRAHYRAPTAVTPDRFGQWIHLAVVYDGPGRRVRHYLDGRQVSDEPTKADATLRIGTAELGNWNTADYRAKVPIRHFSGGMDELMLFDRPLSNAEVERLHTQGRPPS